ncbi:MAG: hypothetical protein AB7P03_08515 [Kofleriaceae bacterium]
MHDAGHVYVAVSDPAKRMQIVEDLRKQGWTVFERPTGFHVLGDIADIIEGKPEQIADVGPVKVVVDAYARGCTGKSLAAGLRELGLAIPVELVENHASA